MTISTLQQSPSIFDQSLAALPAKLNNVPRDYRELKSLFMTLRQEDEAFKRTIQVSHFKAKSCVATAQDLSEKMYLLIKGRVHLICKNENCYYHFCCVVFSKRYIIAPDFFWNELECIAFLFWIRSVEHSCGYCLHGW